ncbi:hypothetical protein HUU05_19775 [candidate division KSB1 bacterium]|nr:hypothetical protein [candidate division KSB1 bacterium]
MEPRYREEAHAQEMFALIERYLMSSLSQIAFCKHEGLPYSRFHYWLKQYRLRQALAAQTATPASRAVADEPPADFIPLRIAPTQPAAPSSKCEIEFPSGIVIRFQDTVDPSVLAALIRAEQAKP